MSNAMKYFKALEAVGFERNQAEAQVQIQMVLDAVDGDLMITNNFAVFREHLDPRFAEIGHRFNEIELRLVIKLGLITVTTTSIAVAILTWLIKIQ